MLDLAQAREFSRSGPLRVDLGVGRRLAMKASAAMALAPHLRAVAHDPASGG